MTQYTEAERLVAQIVDDTWSFEQVEGLVKLATDYDDGEAFDATNEIVAAQ